MSSSDSFELFSSSSAADSSASAAALVLPGSAEAPPRLSVRELLANKDLVAHAEAASQSDYHAARLAALRAGGGGGSANPGSGPGPTEAVPIHAGNASSPALGLSSSSSASEHNIKVSEVLADRRRLAQMEEMAATITTASKVCAAVLFFFFFFFFFFCFQEYDVGPIIIPYSHPQPHLSSIRL